MPVRIMRILRMKYKISLAELADACGVSVQRISEIELKTDSGITPKTAAKIESAFTSIAEKKYQELDMFRQDFARYKDRLMECVEEYGYEL